MTIINDDLSKEPFDVNSPGFSKYMSMIQNKSINSREIIVWFRNKEDFDIKKFFWCNDAMSDKLGLTRNKEGLIVTQEYYDLFVQDAEGLMLIEELKAVSMKVRTDHTNSDRSYIVKLRNKLTNKLVYLHYILEIFERYPDGSIKSWGGNGMDVTEAYKVKAQFFEVKRKGVNEVVKVSDILYVEVINKKAFIVTSEERYQVRESFKELTDRFNDFDFILIYRGCMVNPNHIKVISKDQIVLLNGKSLPLSRYRAKDVKDELDQFRNRVNLEQV